MATRIRIDHDIPYSEYNTSILKGWIKKLPYDVQAVYIRQSCGGNTHVCVKLAGKLSRFEQLMVRATLHDDARRIRGDLERTLIKSPAFGLLFDIKIDTAGTVHTAGDWVKINHG